MQALFAPIVRQSLYFASQNTQNHTHKHIRTFCVTHTHRNSSYLSLTHMHRNSSYLSSFAPFCRPAYTHICIYTHTYMYIYITYIYTHIFSLSLSLTHLFLHITSSAAPNKPKHKSRLSLSTCMQTAPVYCQPVHAPRSRVPLTTTRGTPLRCHTLGPSFWAHTVGGWDCASLRCL